MNYYNEFDPYAAQWLRNLIAAGAIPPGHVDQRSITEVKPEDLAGFVQCHFFAGIAGWSLALKLAGIDPSTPLWTGSCPCQPFSAAGKRKGTEDERHLWPVFRDLIAQCKPPIVLGEQVASADGRGWLAAVRSDMEALGYAVGASDLCAAGIGAPHIRQRIYFVGLADAGSPDLRGESGRGAGAPGKDETRGQRPERERRGDDDGSGGADGGLADADRKRHDGIDLLLRTDPARRHQGEIPQATGSGSDGGLADTDDPRPQGRDREHAGAQEREDEARHPGPLCAADDSLDGGRPGTADSFWGTADWLFCRDGKWRPVEPGTFPLAHGIPNRVGRLRAYGNAIVPQVAATFIRAALPERKTD